MKSNIQILSFQEGRIVEHQIFRIIAEEVNSDNKFEFCIATTTKSTSPARSKALAKHNKVENF